MSDLSALPPRLPDDRHWTARQAVQRFGEDKVSEKIREALKDDKSKDKLFEFVQAIYPREDRDTRKRDNKNVSSPTSTGRPPDLRLTSRSAISARARKRSASE